MHSLDETEAQCIKECKELFDNVELKYSLVFITANFVILPATISKLEGRGLKVQTAVQLVEDVGKK